MTVLCILIMTLAAALSLVVFPRKFELNIKVAQFLWAVICLLTLAAYYTLPTTWHWQYEFLTLANFKLKFMLGFDALSQVMLAVVVIISFIIFQYAKRYLASDVTRSRFLAQLCLVTVSVMLLILAANLLTAFIAWQLVGLNLYLLLNHYHYDLQANRAAKKKFIITRVGDLCFLMAIVLAYQQTGTSTFESLLISPHPEAIALLIFIAVMTKSAQFPFHIWLADTMETPTPVSALMHAGVINAGGFLLTRIASLLSKAPVTMEFIFIIGLLTALLGSFFMLTQADTKKKLAYSTMGQMGYMVMQCGLGAFPSAVFHLIAHGFLKATLFLNAGSTLQFTPATRNDSKPFSKVQLILWTLIISISFMIIASLFSAFIHLSLPIVIWGFIALTVMQLLYRVFKARASLQTLISSILGIMICFMLYLLVLARFNTTLVHFDYTAFHIGSWQFILIGVLILGQLGIWCLPFYHKGLQCGQTLYYLSVRKLFIEEIYRCTLLYPLRRLGDLFNQVCHQKLSAYKIPKLLIVIMGFLIFSGISNHFSITSAAITYTRLEWFFICFLLLAGIIANRASTLSNIFIWILILEMSLIGIGLFDQSFIIQKVALFHLINMLLVMGMLATLMLNRDVQPLPVNIPPAQNCLPWLMFYLSTGLLLLIGIPGTASFIAELSFLIALMQAHLILAIFYASGMILLSIVVLHALQTYVFDYHFISLARSPISPFTHIVCWGAIIINILNGMHPDALLNLLSL